MRRWLKILLAIPVMLMIIAGVAWMWLWHTESGAQWVWDTTAGQLAKSQRPATLVGHIDGTLGGGLRIQSLQYQDADVTAAIDSGSLSIRLGLVPITVDIAELHLSGVEVRLEDTESGTEDSSLADIGDLGTPYPIHIRSLRIDDGVFRRGDLLQTIHTIEGELHWHQNLNASFTRFETPEISGSLGVESALAQPFNLEAETRIQRFTAAEAIREQAPWIPEELDATATISGSVQNLEITGQVRWPDWLPEGEFEVQVLPLDTWSWTLGLLVPRIELPERWVEESIGSPEPASPGKVVVSQISLHGEGREDAWAFNGAAAIEASWIQSNAITFGANGAASEMDAWKVSGDALVSATDWPTGTLKFDAGGTKEILNAKIHAPELFGGSLSIEAETQPGEARPWSGLVEVGNLSLSPLLDSLSPYLGDELTIQLETAIDLVKAEKLTATVAASGTMEPFATVADVKHLATGIKGRPMTATGKLEISQDSFTTPGFSIQSGESALRLSGQLDGGAGLGIAVAIADLDDFFPGSAGSLSGQIQYRLDPGGNFAESWLRAKLQGESLEFQDWRVQYLALSELDKAFAAGKYAVFAETGDQPPLALELEATQISGPAGDFSSLSAALQGRINDFAVAFATETRNTGLTAELTTRTTGEDFDAWNGTLQKLHIKPPQGLPWALSVPAEFRYQDGITVASACFEANGTASLCIGIEQGLNGSELGHANLAALSPDLFSAMTDWPLSFSQQMSGTVNWTRTVDSEFSALADLVITPGVVIDQAEGTELLQSEEGRLHFRIEDNSLVAGTLDIPLDSGRIDIEFALPDLLEDSDTGLNGRIRIDLDSLDAVSSFIPNLAQVAGVLAVDLVVAGTPENPRLSGTTSLKQGSFRLPATGLNLSDMTISGQLDNENQINLDGIFKAGAGNGQLRARLDMTEPLHPVLEARLTGQGMTLINTPEILLLADTDIQFSWAGNDLNVLGTINVPTARFAPRFLPSDTASESADVVLVSNGAPIVETEEADPNLNIHGDVAVSLGDAVVIDLELARAQVRGAAMFSWRGDPLPIANGEYNIKGDIQAYGQTLEITRAAIRYPNVPADSPYLDIRAERTIYGNSLVTKAGVLVNGTLNRPQTEPYTVPATNADRARALLITGSDFDYEQGVGAVNVGTYIAPKLYLSYGVGLFEEGNVITARYELKRNFGVKATSGQDETGIDFSYTIER